MPYVFSSLIRSLLTDDVLQWAYDEVNHAQKRDREDEILYAQSILDTSRVFGHVFQLTEIFNAFVRGPHETTRENKRADPTPGTKEKSQYGIGSPTSGSRRAFAERSFEGLPVGYHSGPPHESCPYHQDQLHDRRPSPTADDHCPTDTPFYTSHQSCGILGCG